MQSVKIFKPLNILLTILLCLILYCGNGYLSAYFLFQDLYHQKFQSDDSRINFSQIRISLKSKMKTCIMEAYNNDPNLKDNPFALMFMPLAENMLNSYVDTFVSPEGLQAQFKQRTDNSFSGDSQQGPNIIRMFEFLYFTSPAQMKGSIEGVDLIFNFKDFQWRPGQSSPETILH